MKRIQSEWPTDLLRAHLLRPFSALADFLYPPACSVCGISTGDHRGLCAKCWSGIRFIERPYCEVLGIPFSHDLGVGILSAEAIANPPPFDRLRSAATHDHAIRDLVHGLKYRDRTDLAPMMAGWMLRASDGAVESCDALIPVPLHRTRMLARKFNQAAELARHMASLSGKPLLAATLIRVKRTSQQVGLGAKAREDNVRGAFAIAKGCENDVFGKRIVLVDDVYTTGATVAAASRTLRKAGAAEITVLTFARALSEPI
ncbi:ComF family protein [Rhizobium lentis]|uniref:ComF family protein n=1 Tax=Rhizobium TaxID=379 RepID=UPI00160771A4|nr:MULTISPECIES: ComF family protein [Rhizobium]MBB3355081.1 ComF family protein [Rhizobium sp. BK049]MBX5136997.1 ComF family protein [Rhizobium lentis]MBX5142996.1 ComF family protein [Rhizobium lentis]MBX5154934.1 ComF family protein [Rhizobium lentis]MBX5180693.1 ComF family protein [Rhizobium lentis]